MASAEGGPGPTPRQSGLALRQRILADAAVRALGDRQPLVVRLPFQWSAPDAADLVSGLAQTWLEPAGLIDTAATQLSQEVPVGDVATSLDEADAAVPDELFDSVEEAIERSGPLERILGTEHLVTQVTADALISLSYMRRDVPYDGAALVSSWITGQLNRVRVQGPRSVTLSGSSGRFAATVTNRLSRPVTVTVTAREEPGIALSTPPPVTVPAEGSATVVFDAERARAGVHNIELSATDAEGNELGQRGHVPVRAAQVSGVIWIFIGVGATLLFGAIGARLLRRVRAARGGEDDNGQDDGDQDEAADE
jgi:hypothetical protein